MNSDKLCRNSPTVHAPSRLFSALNSISGDSRRRQNEVALRDTSPLSGEMRTPIGQERMSGASSEDSSLKNANSLPR